MRACNCLRARVVGCLVEPGELFLEFGVVKPTAEGTLGDAGIAGGLGDGGGEGDDGQYGLLAGSEVQPTAGNFDFPVKSCQIRHFLGAGVAGAGLGGALGPTLAG